MQNAARRAPDQGGRAVPSLQLVQVARKPTDDAAYWRTDPSVVTLERLRDGDMEAFQVLFSKYRGAIARYGDRFLRSRDRANEIAQSVFLQLFLEITKVLQRLPSDRSRAPLLSRVDGSPTASKARLAA